MMAITIQNYEWRLTGQGAYVATDYPSAGNDLSLFISPFGNRIEIPPFVKEDEFVVISHFGSTPGVLADPVLAGGVLSNWIPNGFLQIVINTTGYYQDPQNTWEYGISGDAAPYPLGLTDIPAHYILTPPIYVLPEQTWDFRYTMMNDLQGYAAAAVVTSIPVTTLIAQCHVQYYLFNGPDALICHQLLQLGIPITVDNVEWYKKMLLQQRGLDTDTWEHYLKVSEAFRDIEKKREKYGRRTRKA